MSKLPNINMSEGWQDLSNCPTNGILEFLHTGKDGEKYIQVANIAIDNVYYNEHTKWRPLTELMKQALLNVNQTIDSPAEGSS